MMNNCIGIINLDENEQKTIELTRRRPLASLPIYWIKNLLTKIEPIKSKILNIIDTPIFNNPLFLSI